MGYTHYWTFRIPRGEKHPALEKKYQLALKECAKVAHVYNEECNMRGEDWARLSGYTAHTPIGTYGGVLINGKESNAHESFELREHFKQNFEGFGGGFSFCKTARKPYDIVVTACLAILKYRLGNAIEVSTNGESMDWIDGILLARRAIKRKVPNPVSKQHERKSA
jgi:hypothetical protein